VASRRRETSRARAVLQESGSYQTPTAPKPASAATPTASGGCRSKTVPAARDSNRSGTTNSGGPRSGMFSGQIAEHERRAEGSAVPAVGHSHHRTHSVARGVEPVDHRSVHVQNSAVSVGTRAAFRPKRAAGNPDRVIRRGIDGANGRLRREPERRVITPGPVVMALAPMKVGIHAGCRLLVPPSNSRDERLGWHADPLR